MYLLRDRHGLGIHKVFLIMMPLVMWKVKHSPKILVLWVFLLLIKFIFYLRIQQLFTQTEFKLSLYCVLLKFKGNIMFIIDEILDSSSIRTKFMKLSGIIEIEELNYQKGKYLSLVEYSIK